MKGLTKIETNIFKQVSKNGEFYLTYFRSEGKFYYKRFKTLEEAKEFRNKFPKRRNANPIDKSKRIKNESVDRNIRKMIYLCADGKQSEKYVVTSKIKLDGITSKNQYFDTLQDAIMYRNLVENKRRIKAKEEIDIFFVGNEYPHNVLKALGVTPEDYDSYDDIAENFEKRFASINDFTPRELEIFNCRFKNYLSLEETGKEFGVTRERIRQIEAKMLRKLKSPKRFNSIIFKEEKLELLNAEETARIRNELKNEMTEEVALEIVFSKYGIDSLEDFEERINRLPVREKNKIIINDIESLNLSQRSYNCLTRAGIKTINDLIKLNEEDLVKIRNLGRKSYKEIKEKIENLGLSFAE